MLTWRHIVACHDCHEPCFQVNAPNGILGNILGRTDKNLCYSSIERLAKDRLSAEYRDASLEHVDCGSRSRGQLKDGLWTTIITGEERKLRR